MVVIGAGPTGLAAALGALRRGAEVTLLERGEVGDALRTWGPARFFTPLRMNLTAEMRELLGPVDDEALLTGPEMADLLASMAAREPLQSRLRTGTNVVAVGRRGMTKRDYPGHPLRAERPFRLLLEAGGGEEVLEADVVLDATGGYVLPTNIGAGGLPAAGERAYGGAIRTLGALHARLGELRGKRLLLIGHGHSAANAIEMLSTNETHVTWAVRTSNRRPCVDVANDPLPERQHVVGFANDQAEAPPAWLTVERRATVEGIYGDGATLSGNRRVACDAIAAFTGFRPDTRLVSELAVEASPVTEGGAKLYRAISNVTDCLTVPRLRPEDLATGEPNYWLIGSRIYGRAPTFLLQTGYQQLETILDTL
jgi:thioredoxin reductase